MYMNIRAESNFLRRWMENTFSVLSCLIRLLLLIVDILFLHYKPGPCDTSSFVWLIQLS
jgi:hypothetical protein